MIKLDYTLQTPEERNELVKKILEENPEPNETYLNTLADYLIMCMEKQEKKERKILTENRMTTVNKRETSFEGLVSKLENGEDGIYNLMNDSKTIIFQPKITITKKDVDEIPSLRQLREAICSWEAQLKRTSGKDAYIIKKALIELRKDQYLIKTAYRKPLIPTKLLHSKNWISLDESLSFDADGYVAAKGISLCDPAVCSAILCNYSKLKEDSYDRLDQDLKWLILDFEDICDAALAKHPLYMRLLECKIDGMQNIDIQTTLQLEFGIKHSMEYISCLWRNKIPGLIASAAEDQELNWYYLTKEKGKYKKCSRCGSIKLAHNKYFSKNKTSKDSFYSICKECRNSKKKNKEELPQDKTIQLE